MTKPPSRPDQRGFTLIEMIIFIVVVSVALAGILSVMNTVVKSSADPMVRKQSFAIAESLLEEILLKNYCDPDPGGADPPVCGTHVVKANRADYDNVSDYNGYTTTGIVDLTGAATSGLSNYNISPQVAVSSTTLGGLTVKQVVVSVTDPQGNVYSLTGYRANY
ncbi:hypothetical protein GALL_449270 [mine drainage metagenome]|uniref:MSHA pilin protein MshD n=1 Tax=mine drainage metagenome TaxID=410659 RepID=A0A1J5Q0Q4_9ZZZZ